MRLSTGLFVLSALVYTACGPKNTTLPEAVGPTVVAPQNLFLRSAFDTDPSAYLGRFVPQGEENIDETSAMPLTCSKHLTMKKIDGGGVMYDELFNASSQASASVGVPMVASVEAGGGRSSIVRVKYTLTEKMVAAPEDPAAFESCCKQAPDQCTELYVGEFVAGTGEVYYEVSSGGGVDANGISPQGVTGDIEIKHGVTWKRGVQFPNPVYFAFKTTKNHWKADVAASGCGDWTDGPPKSSQGHYFVGISRSHAAEADARTEALTSGREQVVRYLAESIQTGSVQIASTSGATDQLTTSLESEKLLHSASEGVASLVKDESWCVEEEATPGGTLRVAKVLMFLPKEDEAAAGTAAVEALSKPDGADDASK
ncbi:MAG: hypothetical protein EP330_22260 [Deltaproteobacteria bacterium]|nr:MAG: hypothetical protein EP330_22260 [Deltaproteobacteria bacterium]